ncbi:T9SS type A sorting domain-containing protein [Hymenobacter terricola]|uniref:T9SS type A sorting domain-containing protein n=1 Tax=Hymenobacter terricola TaxID=2819236 RepID=UPI001B305907|nr:T9SS type A sorting domain-containing protein [Hymenobacter terricola]
MKTATLRWVVVLTAFLWAGMGHAQGVKWAKRSENYPLAGVSVGYQVVVDAAGNTYIAGTGGARVEFDGLAPAAQRGTGSMFVLKRDPTGQPLWLLRGGGAGATPLGLALDGTGQPVVAGSFTGTAAFGSTTLTSAGGTDGFVARLSAGGAWLGAVRAGGPGADQFAGLAVQADGTAFVTGRFLQTATFAGLPPLATPSGSSVDTNVLVARLSPANAWQWAVGAGQSSLDAGQGITADASGRVSVTGYFKDSIDFDNLPRLRSRTRDVDRYFGSQDVFVAQLDAATGAWQWATRAGGRSLDAGMALATDASGALYISGYFRESIDFGDSLALPVLTAQGTGTDVLLARLSPTGTWQWATQAGTSAASSGTSVVSNVEDQGLTVAVDPAGTRVTTGGTLATGVKSFGPAPAQLTLADPNTQGFVAQAAGATGTWLNAIILLSEGSIPQITHGVALGPGGTIMTTGQYVNTINLGPARRTSAFYRLPRYNDGLPYDQNNLFAAQLNPDAGTWAQPLLADNGINIEVNATAHDAAGNTYVTGQFNGNMVLDTPTPTRLTGTGRFDAFVGKLDPAGQWLWVIGTTNGNGHWGDSGTGIAVDAAGRVTVTGYFQNSRIGFGSLSAAGSLSIATGLVNVVNLPGNDVFVAQFDAATGTPRWLTSLVGNDDIQAFGLSRDPATDDLTLAGTFAGTATVSSGGTISATATGQYDGFAARISAAGQWQWLRQGGGTGIGNGTAYNRLVFNSVSQDASGAYTIGGLVQGDAQLGGLALPGSNMVFRYFPFIAHLNAAGTTWEWQHTDNAYYDYIDGFPPVAAADAAGNVYWPAPYNSSGYPLLRQYSPTGTLLRSVAVPNATVPAGLIAPDEMGGIVVAGTYTGPATFGSTTLAGSGRFVARLDATGAWTWAGNVSGALLGNLAVVDAGGTMTMGGSYESPVNTPVATPFVVARLLPPPGISSFTPGSGNSGTSVTLTGMGFTDAATVAFNGTNAPGFVVSNGGTTIVVTVPFGATTGPITVTSVGGVGTSATPFVILVGDLVVSTPQNVQGTYNNVLVTGPATGGAGVGTLTGSLTVLNSLTIQDGGMLLTECQPLTGTGSFALEAGGTLGICDVAGISPSGPTGAVQVTGTRTYSDDASYRYTAADAQVTGQGLPTTVRELQVNLRRIINNLPPSLTLNQDVNIRQALRLRAWSLVRAGHSITLLSGAAGTALVENAGGTIASGPGLSRMQRYIDPGLNPGVGYRHYYSPVPDMLLSAFAAPGFTPEFNTAFNSSATPGSTTPFPTVFTYDQARLTTSPATSFLLDFDKGWAVPAAGSTFEAAGAITAHVPATALLTFEGAAFFNGNFASALARGPQAEAGWALVGNPYPSPFDLSEPGAVSRTNVDAAVYLYESTGAYSGTYRAYVNGMGSANAVVPAGQAFFVRTTTAGPPASFGLTNSGRVTTYAAQPTFRRTVDLRPQVRLTLHSTGTSDDNVFLYAEAGATAGVDAAFDAHKLLNPGEASVFAVAAGGEPMAIQGLPAFTAATVVPLTLDVPQAGQLTMEASLSNLPAGLAVYLRDALTGTRQNLSIQPRYVSSIAQAGRVAGRFQLVFGPATAPLSASVAQHTAISLYPNPAHHSVVLTLPAAAVARPVQLIDALGRTIRTLALPANATEATLDLTGLSTGMYVVRCGLAAERLVVE